MRFIPAILIFFSLLFHCERAQAIAPSVAGTLSIIPGLGQVSTGETLEGVAWFASVVGLFSSGSSYARDVGFKLWEYNLYDAYRDAHGQDTVQTGVVKDYLSFLNPVNLFDPYSVGIVGYGSYRALTASSTASLGPRSVFQGAFYYGFVGLGEEGLFRGFLFPGFSHLTGSYFVGGVLSSIAFSASHLMNKQSYYHSAAGLGELFLLGAALSMQTYRNHFDLRHSIFTHAWYDIIIDYAGKKADGEGLPPLGLKVGFEF